MEESVRIVIVTAGSFGDVAPYGGLAARLAASGHGVAIATHRRFAPMVRDWGVGFRLVATEVTTAMGMAADAGEDGRRFEAGPRALVANVELASALTRASARDIADAVQDGGADLLLLSATVAPLGWHVAEGLGIPSAGAYLLPHHPTRELAPVLLPVVGRAGPWLNRAAGRAIDAVVDGWVARAVRELRAELGLPPVSPRALRRRLEAGCWPVYHGFSPAVVPRPSDWRPGLHVVGYWWPPRPVGWQPPADLVDFLQAGPSPVLVGFGSMGRGHREQLADVAVSALRRARLRGVVQSGWAGLSVLGDDVMTVGQVPHDWLMPRMAAVVHHAGAGTTGSTLRAGVPAIPVPTGLDQRFWSERLVALGVAPRALGVAELSAGTLAGALREAVTDPAYGRRARALASRVAAEDGAGRVAELVAGHLERAAPASPEEIR